MKNALILHGTSNDSTRNWFQWLKYKLEETGYTTWVPDLPDADKPNPTTYRQFIAVAGWDFGNESIIIGHSSGAVAVLSLLQHLPREVSIEAIYLVGVFKDNLDREELSELFVKPFDFDLIKTKTKKIFLIHSDNDPYCPLEHAEYLGDKLDGQLVLLPGQAHFSISTAGEKYKEFPELFELINSVT